MLVETGIGERVDEKTRAMRDYEGPWVVAALETAGVLPETIDVVAMSHLHFDHAGGLLRANGDKAFPHAKIVAQKARVGGRARRQPAARRVVRAARAHAGQGLGRRRAGPTASRSSSRASAWSRTGGHSTGHQAIVVRGDGDDGRTLAFFGDLFMRPWAANPRWVTAFDDFPLDSVVRKAELFAQAADEGWLIVLSHEAKHPIGHVVRDRDRFRFEPV